jgi:Fe-Mn family superoxide dismutase
MTMAVTPQDLPYPLDALEPHISRETLEYHHGKHYKGYVDKLNAAIKGTDADGLELAELVRTGEGKPYFNNAAQAWNHEFYFAGFGADTAAAPDGALAEAIAAKYGSFEDFVAQFSEQAKTLFGSGWTWLVLDPKTGLEIVNTANAQTPLTGDAAPLLTCDLWEHAYYIDYRNERPKYLSGFFAVVDWKLVASRYAAARG